MRSATRKRVGRDPAYRNWILLQPCIVMKVWKELVNQKLRFVTGHHVKRGPGAPKEDRRMVPLMDFLHMRTHEIPGQPCVERGKKVFEEFWGVDLEREIGRLNAEYEAQR